MKFPEIYQKISKITRVKQNNNSAKAVLFEGPPGTGKTTSAKILASEIGIMMLYVPLESIMSPYVGESESNLGKIFDLAKKLGKCMIFIDEIDSLAMSRDQ